MLLLPLIITVALIFLVIVFRANVVIKNGNKVTPTPILTPTTAVSPSPQTEELDKIGNDMKEIEQDLETIDIKEIELLPPAVDMNVKLK